MRLFSLYFCIKSINVSIHASVKDATFERGNNRSYFSFNPRICKRCDFSNILTRNLISCFNPRICKRCDILVTSLHCYTTGFNPRICKRCDSQLPSQPSILFVSIHASVKDATNRLPTEDKDELFQSTHL